MLQSKDSIIKQCKAKGVVYMGNRVMSRVFNIEQMINKYFDNITSVHNLPYEIEITIDLEFSRKEFLKRVKRLKERPFFEEGYLPFVYPDMGKDTEYHFDMLINIIEVNIIEYYTNRVLLLAMVSNSTSFAYTLTKEQYKLHGGKNGNYINPKLYTGFNFLVPKIARKIYNVYPSNKQVSYNKMAKYFINDAFDFMIQEYG